MSSICVKTRKWLFGALKILLTAAIQVAINSTEKELDLQALIQDEITKSYADFKRGQLRFTIRD